MQASDKIARGTYSLEDLAANARDRRFWIKVATPGLLVVSRSRSGKRTANALARMRAAR